ENPKPVKMANLYMDIMPGTDEPGFGGLRPKLEMEPVTGYEPSDRPIKIGSIEFTLREALAISSRFFIRPNKAYLQGWLTERDHTVVVFEQLVSHQKAPPAQGDVPQWRVERSGVGARQEAIADLAAQILVGTGASTLTHSWQSFRCFHEAMRPRLD